MQRALLLLGAVAVFDFGLVYLLRSSGYWRSPEEQAQRKAQRAAYLRWRN